MIVAMRVIMVMPMAVSMIMVVMMMVVIHIQTARPGAEMIAERTGLDR